MNHLSRTGSPNGGAPIPSANLTSREELSGAASDSDQIHSDLTPLLPESLDDPSALRETPATTWERKAEGPTPLLSSPTSFVDNSPNKLSQFVQILGRFTRFVGPGFLIAVGYIDPGNYATGVAAGAETRYALLFIIMVSNLFAAFIQSLSIRLGSVTGLNLAQNCKAHLPPWLTIPLYIFAESAIIATDIAEVVGSAIPLNLLFHIPLVVGSVITLVDVLVTLVFYNPQGSMSALRSFEFFVAALVIGVVICFCIQLSMIEQTSLGEVLGGFLPSLTVVRSNGLYLSCGILGATVMPHSIFLGSGVLQSRLRRLDLYEGQLDTSTPFRDHGTRSIRCRASVEAIRRFVRYSIVELTLSLFTFALFVNSSILIVAAASLSGSAAANADLFSIYDLLSASIDPAAGIIFAVALFLSGISAGIVCTIAGQMVSEGMLNWTVAPWLRRLITRSISIVPSAVVAAVVGREGLNTTLTASQIVLSGILPIVIAPLVLFTCRSPCITVTIRKRTDEADRGEESVSMENGWLVSCVAIFVWLIITVMNVALIILVALGKMSV